MPVMSKRQVPPGVLRMGGAKPGGGKEWMEQDAEGRRRRFYDPRNAMAGEVTYPTVDQPETRFNVKPAEAMRPLSAIRPGEWDVVVPEVAAPPQTARPAPPSPPQAGAEVDLDGDGIPDGAEVTRAQTVMNPGGGKTTTTAKWLHKAAEAVPPMVTEAGAGLAAKPEQAKPYTPFERLAIMRGTAGSAQGTAASRTAQEIMGRKATEQARLDQVAAADADRALKEREAQLGAVGQIMAGAGAEAAKPAPQAEQPRVMQLNDGRQVVYMGKSMYVVDPTTTDEQGAQAIRDDDGKIIGYMAPRDKQIKFLPGQQQVAGGGDALAQFFGGSGL